MPSTCFDWYFCRSGDAGRAVTSLLPQAGGADSTLLRTTLIVGPGAVILGLLILVFHLTRPWTFWKLMFHYSFTSVMSMGVMLFQLYMVVLVLWLAKIFEHDLLACNNAGCRSWGSCKRF